MVLIVIWMFFGTPKNLFTGVHPRKLLSIPAILFSSFFHLSKPHLVENLIFFIPLGFLVFKLEGMRGVVGIFVGMLGGGVAVWLFGTHGSMSAGFSGAVFACWGILFVSVIRRDYRWVVVFLFLSYMFLEQSLFETIRPTASAKAGNISWLGHLGGLIGGMASQIRSLPVALELLYKEGKVTKEEFIVIANRIHKNTSDEVGTANIHKAANDFQKETKESADSKKHTTRENTDGKE